MLNSQSAVNKAVHATLRQWYKPSLNASLNELHLVHMEVRDKGASLTEITKSAVAKDIVRQHIEEMRNAPQTKQQANILTRRFLDNVATKTIAFDYGKSIDQINRLQKKALKTLGDLIWEAEKTVRHALQIRQLGHLETPTYKALVGVEGKKQELLNALFDGDDTQLVNLVGLGGLGKSSLADVVCRQLSETLHFEYIFWVKVPSVGLSPDANEVMYAALLSNINKQLSGEFADNDATNHERIVRDFLRQKQCLLVIDNVEAAEHLHFLVQKLGDLAPSKLLITSRVRFTGQSGVKQILLEELEQADAFAFVRHWATYREQVDLAQADETILQSIYDVTGGNPLALKLVVGLTTYDLPLVATLTGLRAGHDGEAKDMYTRIYWYAWKQLDESAQTVLKAMLISGIKGTKSARLQKRTKLDEMVFWQSVQALIKLSLLETRGTPLEPRYGIHQLTASFLNTEIVRPKQEKG